MADDGAFRIGVDLERYRLSWSHRVELNLLEVRNDPDFVGHKHREGGPGLGVGTYSRAELDNASWLVCRHGRIGKVQLRLVVLSLRLREACDCRIALRLQRFNLRLRQLQSRLRAPKRGVLLAQLGCVLLGI